MESFVQWHYPVQVVLAAACHLCCGGACRLVYWLCSIRLDNPPGTERNKVLQLKAKACPVQANKAEILLAEKIETSQCGRHGPTLAADSLKLTITSSATHSMCSDLLNQIARHLSASQAQRLQAVALSLTARRSLCRTLPPTSF